MPRTVAAYNDYSRRLLIGSIDVENIRRDLAAVLALKIDLLACMAPAVQRPLVEEHHRH